MVLPVVKQDFLLVSVGAREHLAIFGEAVCPGGFEPPAYRFVVKDEGISRQPETRLRVFQVLGTKPHLYRSAVRQDAVTRAHVPGSRRDVSSNTA
jgi:hypothetical protein